MQHEYPPTAGIFLSRRLSRELRKSLICRIKAENHSTNFQQAQGETESRVLEERQLCFIDLCDVCSMSFPEIQIPPLWMTGTIRTPFIQTTGFRTGFDLLT